MSATFYPPPLNFPAGWPVGNSIGPIINPYGGPDLLEGPATVTFQLGAQVFTNPNDITIAIYEGPDLPVPGQEHLAEPEMYTPNYLITIHVFEPALAGDIPYKMWVDYNVDDAMKLKHRDLAAGVWHICPVPPVPAVT